MARFQAAKNQFLSGVGAAASPFVNQGAGQTPAGEALSQAGADITRDAASVAELGDDFSAFTDFFTPNPDDG
jgi:hypothetical protein